MNFNPEIEFLQNNTYTPKIKRVDNINIDNSDEIASLIVKKVESIDKKDVYMDLLPFIESTQTLENFFNNFVFLIKENIKNVI